MARLPTPGGDSGDWGTILNDFLVQSHNGDGTIKDGVVTKSALEASVQDSLDSADTALQTVTKADIGLGSVDNTSDVNKPVSTAAKAYVDRLAIEGDYSTGVYINAYEFAPYYGVSNETSTFSGWAGHIGTPQDFDTITTRIKNRDTTTLTALRIVISIFNKAGTVLVDKTYAVSIAAGETQTVTLDLDSVIANTAANKLYLGYQGNKYVSFTGMQLPAQSDDILYGKTAYITLPTSMSQPISAWVLSSTLNKAPWIRTSKKQKLSGQIATTSFIKGSGFVIKDSQWDLSFVDKTAGFNFLYAIKPFSAIAYNYSTFSGWGSYVGTAQNFSAIRFKVRNRTGNASNLTRIKVYLYETSTAGTLLAADDLTVDFVAGVENEVIWNIGATIPNTSGAQLYFVFQCNQVMDLYSSTITPNVANGTYCAQTSYATAGSMPAPASMQNVFTPVSTIIWTEFGTTATIYAPSDLFKQEIAASNNSAAGVSYDNVASGLAGTTVQAAIDELDTAIGSGGAVMPRIILPDEFVGVVGDKLQLFVRPIIEAQNPYINPYEVSCSVGKSFPRYFELTPVIGDVGTKTLTVRLQDNSGVDKVTDTANIVIVNPTGAPASNKNILCVGDSLTDGKVWPGEAYRRLTQSGGTPAGLGYNNISFIGTDTMPSYPTQRQVGHGGWTWSLYTGATSVKSFTIQCAGHDKDQSDQKSYYNDGNGNLWWLETIGASSIKVIAYSHSFDLPASGTLTWSSGGVHHSNIIFTSIAAESSTPFWDSATSQFSFTAFMNNNGYTGQSIDALYVLLGWNGMPGQNKYLPTDHATSIDTARIFLNKLHEQYPNAKARVMGIQVPSLDGGLATSYGASGTYSNYYKLLRSANGLNLGYQDLCNEPGISDFAKFLPTAHQFDSEYNMPSASVAVNSRSATTERQGNNGVHPDTPGYLQIGDVVYRDFIRSFCS